MSYFFSHSGHLLCVFFSRLCCAHVYVPALSSNGSFPLFSTRITFASIHAESFHLIVASHRLMQLLLDFAVLSGGGKMHPWLPTFRTESIPRSAGSRKSIATQAVRSKACLPLCNLMKREARRKMEGHEDFMFYLFTDSLCEWSGDCTTSYSPNIFVERLFRGFATYARTSSLLFSSRCGILCPGFPMPAFCCSVSMPTLDYT